MTHIFISYSHDDSDYAHKLEKALKKRGFEVWIDDRIGYGETWPQVLQEQVDACGAFIVILTPRSYGSDWVQNELARAKRKKKPVFPLLLEGDNWLAVEATQCADVRDGKLPPPVFYSRLERVFNSTGMAAPRREREPEVNYRCPPPRVPMPGEHSSTVSISNVTGGINSTIIAGRDVKDTSVATDGQASPVCEDDLDE